MRLSKYIFIALLLCSQVALATNGSVNASMSATTLKNALKAATLQAGDTVFFENGTYTDFQVLFKATGTASQPVVFIARNPGSVFCEGSIQVNIGGSYVEVNGLCFRNGKPLSSDLIFFRENSSTFANNCRLTNCVVDGCNNTTRDKNDDGDSERWVMLYGKNNRVDHCYFANKDRAGVLMMMDLSDANSRNNNHRVDHNFFGYREVLPAGNGGEAIRPGDSKTSQYSSQSIIEDNYFYTFDGEIEIISLKSCDNIVRRNTFRKCAGMVVCRHGHRNTIESNVFIGDGRSNSGGVRVINQGHKIYNNYFEGLKGTGMRSALCVMTGIFEMPTSIPEDPCEPFNAYVRAKDVDVAFNTFVSCSSIELGTMPSYTYSSSSTCPGKAGQAVTTRLPAQNIKVYNNILYNMPAPVKASSSDTSGIIFKNNIANLSTSWTKEGVAKKDIKMVKTGDVYKLDNSGTGYCMPPLNSVGDFGYITTDATNSARENGNDVGAVNYENISKNYSAALPGECGVSWYSYTQP